MFQVVFIGLREGPKSQSDHAEKSAKQGRVRRQSPCPAAGERTHQAGHHFAAGGNQRLQRPVAGFFDQGFDFLRHLTPYMSAE